MKKRITWATVILLFVLIISMSANLIAQATWTCGECSRSCDDCGEGYDKCDSLGECCGYCEDEEGVIQCLCCVKCGEPI